MNGFTAKRSTNLLIAALVILNLTLLAGFWYTRLEPREEKEVTGTAKPVERDKEDKKGPKDDPRETRTRRRERLVRFLQKELDFSQDQVNEFLRLREEHFEKADGLQRRMDDLRKEMMDHLLDSEPDRVEVGKLADAIGEKLAAHEKAVFEHFLQLMAVCDAEQEVKYRRLLREILHQLRPPGGKHPGEGKQQPPDRQHPGGERGAAGHINRLRRELMLTPTQEDAIRRILEEAKKKLQSIPHDPAYRGHPERREAAEQVTRQRDRQIRDLLTEEQKQRFDRMDKQRPPRER